MIGAISNAIGGLNEASTRFERAARSLTEAGTTASAASAEARSGSESTVSSQSRESNGSSGRAAPLSGDPIQPPPALQDDSIERSAVDLRLAEISYQASARVLKSINNTQDQLLDVLR